MKAMDCDGDERVSLAEFRKWWESKGGMEYGADPAMWSAGAADEWLKSSAAAVEETEGEEVEQPEGQAVATPRGSALVN